MVLWARHGDRTGERKWHVAAPMLPGGAAIGVCAPLPTFWALPTSFLGGAAAGGIALITAAVVALVQRAGTEKV